MKKYRMPFEYWEDDHTKLIRKTKAPEFVDPDYYVEAHWHSAPDGSGPYFLNRRCLKLIRQHGPFKGRYVDGEALCDTCVGDDAYIVAPGPSLKEVDLSALEGKLTFALNSAGFLFSPKYWVIAESSYAMWMLDRQHPVKREVIATARVAVILRAEEVKSKHEHWTKVHVVRWEEEKIVPPRTPAVSLSNALVSAWEMGCKRAYLLGVDLSKPGRPYVEGVPHTEEGAENPFDDQVRAMRQFQLPGFEIVNCSPHSVGVLPFSSVSYQEVLSASV